MIPLRQLALAAALALTGLAAHAQATIKIGEVNSYKAQPAFLEPYKKGMELAVEEINASADRWSCPSRCGSRPPGR